MNQHRMGGLILAAIGLLVGVASAKPPQQAEPASGVAHFTSKVEQTVYEKKLGLVASEVSDNGGMVLRGTCPNSVVRTPAVAIPDNTPGGVIDQVTTVGDPLSNVKVQLNILHSWQGDVTVTLSHDASGTAITLVNRPGNPESTFGFSADNYGDNGSSIPFVLDDAGAQRYDIPVTAVNNVTGSWLPDDPFFQTLSIFNGLTANTTWTLTVSDGAGGDTGTLVRWAICSDNAIATGALEGAGTATPSTVQTGENTTIDVQVTPGLAPPSTGITVTADLSLLGGSSSQSLTDMGGNLFSYTHMVVAGPGIWNVPFTVSDLEGRMFSGSTTVTVIAGNDICETAESINIGDAVIGSNAGATNDPGLPTCSGLSTFNLGVWYTFEGNGNILNVTTCGPNTTLNTRLYVYAGSCGSFTCVSAASGTSPACSPSTAASVVFCSTMGQTYYVLVTNDTTGTGNFDFSVQDLGPCPMNDNCPGDMVTAPSNTAGTTVGSTPSGNTLCGSNGFDVFYNFTPTVSGSYTIDLCGSSFDTRLSVFTDCPAATLFPLGCNDDFCGLQSGLTLNLDAGITYYIRVSAFSATVTGSFVLNISAPPVPTGGCCVGNVCSISTEADCQTNGGSYLGDGTDCGGPAQFTFSSSPALSIPDNNPAGAFDDIVIAAGETITDLDVGLFISHTWQGDLIVTLQHVDSGTTVTLIDRPGVPEVSVVGFSENNYGDQVGGVPFVLDDEAPSFQTYDSINVAAPGILNVSGSWLPDLGPLSAFDGLNSAGTWRLTVSDNAGIDTGSVVTWGLIINNTGSAGPCDVNPCPEDWDGNTLVEVLDIFAFLTDWFAGDFDAQNFGGTPGVPAIFAYLTAWFAHGVGPC